jgi:hypothetical protein
MKIQQTLVFLAKTAYFQKCFKNTSKTARFEYYTYFFCQDLLFKSIQNVIF